MRLLPPALLFALLTVHGASAVAVDPWDPVGGSPYTLGDDDGDGHPELRVDAVTPQCAGLYPVVGGGAYLQVAGQSVFAVGATSLCQYAVWGHVDPADPDPTAEPEAEPVVILWLP